MKNVMIDGQQTALSARAHALAKKFNELEQKNRRLAKQCEKFSCDSARYIHVANAYNLAKVLFVEAYGKDLSKARKPKE